ncbi:MAG: nitrogenase component 1 [Clostridiales bacterium]|nr:nitrogenase component 1 [Clostridiales bacterium]
MKHSYRILPIYTADVSGICSALYELGGMTVIHDPSGCNSTYNTHDEIRWYDQDSLIYISGLSEIDAVTGNDRKFTDAVTRAARKLHPAFIALASSPIPFMNGTDFPALARIIEAQTGIPTFFIPSNGMHDYVRGAGAALAQIAEAFVAEAPSSSPSERAAGRRVNILGMTPLDFAAPGQPDSLRRLLTGHGWDTVSVWAMGDDLEHIRHAAKADVNLVVSSIGLAAARVLRRKFQTPYVVGLPTGAFTDDVLAAMERAAEHGENQYPCMERSASCDADASAVTIIGEPVVCGSLAAAFERRHGIPVRLLCPLEQLDEVLTSADIRVQGEEEAETWLKRSKAVIADPLYRPVCDDNAAFYPLPHVAFSGRMYVKQMQDLTAESVIEGFSQLLL